MSSLSDRRPESCATRLALIAVSLALVGSRAVSAEAKAAPAAASAPGPAAPRPESGQRVEITGSDDAAAQAGVSIAHVVTRDELTRFADGNLLDVLRRQPGLTVISAPGSGAGQIRMRGLGDGYVRVLVDGEPAPPGFSLDSISPDLVERVEIMPVAGVEHSTQAIAGTINVVMKRTRSKRQRQFSLVLNRSYGFTTPQASGTYGDAAHGFAWLLTGAARNREGDDRYATVTRESDGAAPVSTTELQQFNHDFAHSWNASPRLTYTFADGGTAQWDVFASHTGYKSRVTDSTDVIDGPADDLGNDSYRSAGRRTLVRNTLQLKRPIDGDTRLELKASYSSLAVDRDSAIDYVDAQGAPSHRELTGGTDDTKTPALSATLRRGFGSDHSVSVGAELRRERTLSTRADVLDGMSQLDGLGTRFDLAVTRPAVFAHDEWDIDKQWSTDLGLRWESYADVSSSDLGEHSSYRKSLITPVLQTVWHIPGDSKRSLRVALSRSWRAPDPSQLSAATQLSADNNFARPDAAGNPALRPELATGVDVSLESELPQSGTLGATVFVRRIDDVIVTERNLEGTRWVSRPFNVGKGTSMGLEMSARFNLATFIDTMKGTSVRADLALYHSHLDSVPGPGNRIDGQVPLTVTLGVDHKFAALPLSWGGTVGYVKNGTSRTSLDEQTYHSGERQLDLYGLWNFSKQGLVRLAASNVLHPTTTTGDTWAVANHSATSSTSSPTHIALRAALEMKF